MQDIRHFNKVWFGQTLVLCCDELVQKHAGVSATNLQPWCFKGQLWIIIFFILLKTWCWEQRLLYSYLFNVIVKCTHHIFPIWQIRAYCSSLHRDSPYLMAAFTYHKAIYTKYFINWRFLICEIKNRGQSFDRDLELGLAVTQHVW